MTRTAGLLAAIAVAAGAFGAHALGADHPRIETWRTAAHYHLVHAAALAIPGLPRWTRRLLLAGLALFSGSLYLLVLLDLPWLGAITPLGGVSFIAGWSVLALRGREVDPQN